MTKRICVIGVEQLEYEAIRKAHFGPMIHHETVPKIIVKEGILYVERSNGVGMLPVDKVVFHGIYENDFDLITGLALWGGPCFPNAFAMMNCRLKLPCLARALKISQFNHPRGFITKNTEINTKNELVAKWGNWHCGENKHRFTGNWSSGEPAVLEPFFAGTSVRIVIIGNYHWQIKLEGNNWLKSIHDETADFMEVDAELLADTRKIQAEMGMDIIANDYIVGDNGEKYLLEVNHIPNMTRFAELREAYIEVISKWIQA